jgi:hypothetical protein
MEPCPCGCGISLWTPVELSAYHYDEHGCCRTCGESRFSSMLGTEYGTACPRCAFACVHEHLRKHASMVAFYRPHGAD